MSTSSGVPVQAHRPPRVLACVLCQHRKIKCDRNTPCSNCIKANVTCTPSTPAPARKRRRPNQDLQERLARCEALLKQYAGGPVPSTKDPVTPPANASTVQTDDYSLSPSTDTAEKQPTGKMIQDGGGTRFIDSHLWSTFYDELQAMRNIVDEEDPDECTSTLGTEGMTPDNADLLLPSENLSVSFEDLHPDPVNTFRLWQIFLDRVNPLTKIIHVPTLQPYVMEAASDMKNVPPNYQALLFAVLLMGACSLSEEEHLQMIGKPRDTMIRKLATGVKRALIKFDFIRNYDMAALQSLVLFLFALQGRYDRHAAWVLCGVTVRIAQKMGYHRDGELLDLPPFEAEMRRRIWWQILSLDGKLAMVSGLSDNFLQGHSDTKLPQNLNDADLFQGATEPVYPREGPTEMAFVLIACCMAQFMLRDNSRSGFELTLLGMSSDDADERANSNASVEKYRGRIRDLELALKELEDRYIDPSAGKVHRAALEVRPMIGLRLGSLLVPMHEQPEWGKEIFCAKDNLFKLIILNNENQVEIWDRLETHGFSWFVRMHFQIDVFTVMTGQLCQHPTGSLADRGWTVVERVYHHMPEFFDIAQKPYAHQAHYTLKAWRVREAAFAKAGMPVEVPRCVMRLRELLPNQESRSSTQSLTTPPATTRAQDPSSQPEQFLGGYLDLNALNWDMWGDMALSNPNGNGNANLPSSMFGNFGFGNMN